MKHRAAGILFVLLPWLVTSQLCNNPEDKYVCLPHGHLFDCANRTLMFQCKGGTVCVPGQETIHGACWKPQHQCQCPGAFPVTETDPCTDFYMCGYSGDTPVYSRCSEGTHFNKRSHACERGHVPGCTDTATNQRPSSCCSVHDVNVPHATDCSRYLMCVSGVWLERSCVSFFFDPITRRCVSDPRVCKQSTVKCSEGDKKRNPDGCLTFYTCNDGQWRLKSCNGLFFDHISQMCVRHKRVCLDIEK